MLKEIARKDYGYIFYKYNDDFLLSVLCGTVGMFTVDLKLNEIEKQSYLERGIDFVNEFAGEIVKFYDNYLERRIELNAEYLIFGIFNSESYSNDYPIYKITDKTIEIDTRNVWHRDRFKSNGYVFESSETKKIYGKASKLLITFPSQISDKKLREHNYPDNKIEKKLFFEFKSSYTHKKLYFDLLRDDNEQSLTKYEIEYKNAIIEFINNEKSP